MTGKFIVKMEIIIPHTSTRQLDDSCEFCEPRTKPWISVEEFGEYWRSKKPYSVTKGEGILNNQSMVWRLYYLWKFRKIKAYDVCYRKR